MAMGWEVMKGDIMQFLDDFHDRGKIPKGLNNTFISLIPKKDGANDIKDYRPISLVGGPYKILSKIEQTHSFHHIQGTICLFRRQTNF